MGRPSLHLFCILATLGAISATLVPGKFSKTFEDVHYGYAGFVKTLYKNSTVKLKVTDIDCEGIIRISWLLRSSSCYGEYAKSESFKWRRMLSRLYFSPYEPHVTGVGYYLMSKLGKTQCNGNHTILAFDDYSDESWIKYPFSPTNDDSSTHVISGKTKRHKRSSNDKAENEDFDSTYTNESRHNGTTSDTFTEPPKSKGTKNEKNYIARVPYTAPYILVVHVSGRIKSVSIEAEMETPLGYLSAREYPLKTTYMIMCIVYLLFAVTWFVLSARNFRDLLRIQFWIGGVVLLGLIERVGFYSYYWAVNKTGVSIMAIKVFSDFVSALERTAARMLLIVVSGGFGIVKPRYAPRLYRVVIFGILYFIAAAAEVLIRNYDIENEIYAFIPFMIIEPVLFCWLVGGMLRTTKILWYQQPANYNLYRFFPHMITLCLVASVAMIIYINNYQDFCMTAWQELWIFVALWHTLSSMLLLLIMVLWRPNPNRHKYAFTPLFDAKEGDEELLVAPEHLSGCIDAAVKEEHTKRYELPEKLPSTVSPAHVNVNCHNYGLNPLSDAEGGVGEPLEDTEQVSGCSDSKEHNEGEDVTEEIHNAMPPEDVDSGKVVADSKYKTSELNEP